VQDAISYGEKIKMAELDDVMNMVMRPMARVLKISERAKNSS